MAKVWRGQGGTGQLNEPHREGPSAGGRGIQVGSFYKLNHSRSGRKTNDFIMHKTIKSGSSCWVDIEPCQGLIRTTFCVTY